MSFLRPLWLAVRAALIATAVFWAAINIVDRIDWKAPLGLTEEVVFFVVFLCGVLMVRK